MDTIKPGMPAEIAFESNETFRRSFLKTVIYEVEGRKVIIAQTVPPITSGRCGSRARLTFLVKKQEITMRYGCQAEVIALIADYRISSSAQVFAVALAMKTRLEVYDLRANYRIQPIPDSGLSFILKEDMPVDIVDISLGGVCISYEGELHIKSQDIVKLTLIIDRKKFSLDGEVIRVWSPQNSNINRGRLFATIQFSCQRGEWESLLGKKILEMQRLRLSQGKL